MKDHIYFIPSSEKWFYELAGKKSKPFATKLEAAKDYVIRLLDKEPKYKPMFTGKTWRQIFQITGIDMKGHLHDEAKF